MKQIIILSIALLAAVSCFKEVAEPDVDMEERRYVLVNGADTRTSLHEEGLVMWEAGDEIKYYSSNGASVKTAHVEQSGTKSELLALVGKDDPYFVAVYGGKGVSSNTGTKLVINEAVPQNQSGSFSASHIAVAYTENVNAPSLYFQNVTSLLKFIVPEGEYYDKIIFTADDGTQISGSAEVSLSSDITSQYVSGGTNSIALDISGGPGVYYMSILPVSINGFTIQIIKDEWVISKKKVSKALDIRTANILNFGNINDIFSGYLNGLHYVYNDPVCEGNLLTIDQKNIGYLDGEWVDSDILASVDLPSVQYNAMSRPTEESIIKSVTKLAASASRWEDGNGYKYDRVSCPYEVVTSFSRFYLVAKYDRPVQSGFGYLEVYNINKSPEPNISYTLNESLSTEDLNVYDVTMLFNISFEGHDTGTRILSVPYECSFSLNYPLLKGFNLDKDNVVLDIGESLSLRATSIPSGIANSATWKSSNTSVATVTSGLVSAIADGEAIITATSTYDPSFSATCKVVVGNQPGTISFNMDGDMSEWSSIDGVVREPDESNAIAEVKGAADEDNIYVYVKRAKLGRWSDLWGGDSGNAGYYYFDFDMDDNPDTGSYPENSHGNYEAWTFLYLFGGSAGTPVFRKTPPGTPKGMTIDNVKCAGCVSSDYIETEIAFPRTDLPSTVTNTISVAVWGNKDANPFTKVTFSL